MNDRDSIVIENARVNNLKSVSLRIPKGLLTVFTGVSGSGKSSIVFGTVAVESQRQLNETFSSFVRNRLPRFERPDVDVMDHLTTAIVVDQRPVRGNARSTVGTMTDLHSVLRVLFSRHGSPSAGPSSVYSFNNPRGMCETCEGLGTAVALDLGKLLDESRSLNDGAIRHPGFSRGSAQWQIYAESGLFDPDRPVGEFSEEERELLLHGSGFTVDRPGRSGGTYKNEYEGLEIRFHRRYLKKGLDTLKDSDRAAAEAVVDQGRCPACDGKRLNPTVLASTIEGLDIADATALEVGELIAFLEGLELPGAAPIRDAALASLRRIDDIGLGYISLDRQTSTLSGGEAQRLKTVRHLGSSLSDLTFVFDEPSVGLHPRDVRRLNDLLQALRDKGNTVLVVEHDPDVIAIADHVVDMGPGAGTAGGEIVFEGTVEELRRASTLTARKFLTVTGLRREVREASGVLPIRHATANNLDDVSVDLPVGVLCAITGVAGSGKSTLMSRVLPEQHPGVVLVDQSSIGLSPRSTPATYIGAMDVIRRLFADHNDVAPGLFSFNSTGACRECHGRGVVETDLAYLDPVTITCEVCDGQRLRPDVLAHTYREHTIVGVLAMTAGEALEVFDQPALTERLTLLCEVGLGYLTLGRPLSTLSGGERQRLKLADRLRDRGTVFVLDEPTTGLHMADVDDLLALLDRLVDDGNSVFVIEHDLDVVKHCDWVVDLGPDAGRHGGDVIFEGTPADLAHDGSTHTGRCLAADLEHVEGT